LHRLRSTLGGEHPDVRNAERNLALQSRLPEGLSKLRSEESSLSNELHHLMPSVAAADLMRNMLQAAPVDADLESAMDNYRRASDDHEDLSSRLAAARIELEAADAAFAYRYQVTEPAALPRDPVKPNPPGIMLASLLGGVVLAWALAILADLATRRIQESWQIARFLQVPVLAELPGRKRAK
jgi:polysaccharide biosynthesis transport protein